MNLPEPFLTNIRNSFHQDGEAYLAVLPDLIEEARQRWGLTDITPVENLSFNYVAYATCPSTALPDGRSAQGEVVLKIGVPHRELFSEMVALRLFNGEGCVRLLEADESRGMFLLERVRPGVMLATLEDDDQSTHIAVDVTTRLWREAPTGLPLIQLTDWFTALKNVRPTFGGGTGPFPEKLFAHVEETLRNPIS